MDKKGTVDNGKVPVEEKKTKQKWIRQQVKKICYRGKKDKNYI